MRNPIVKAAIIGCVSALWAGSALADKVLKVSHQWSTSDVRHKVAQMVADEVAAADVGLELKIYPSKSLFKPKEQYRPLTRGRLDMTVVPLAYAAGQRPAYNLTLMPGLVKNHDHAARLVESPFMQELEKIMAQDDVMVLVHGYLAGGFGGKDKCITGPDDVKGLKIRAAGKSFEQMVAAAGGVDAKYDPMIGLALDDCAPALADHLSLPAHGRADASRRSGERQASVRVGVSQR